MVKYRWRVSFSLPGVPLTGPAQLGDMTISPSSPDATGHSQSAGFMLLSLDDYLDEDAVGRLVLPQLEAVATSAAAIGGSVREPTVHGIVLENAQELEAAGKRTPISGGRFRNSLTVTAAPMDQLKLAQGYRAVGTLPPPERARWSIAARWLWKANSDPNPYDYLLTLWTSFSVLYGPHVTNGEPQAIERFVDAVMTASAKRVVSAIRQFDLAALAASGLALRKGKGSRQVANELQRALTSSAPVHDAEILKLVLLSVYALRCALVHRGQAAPQRDHEIRLVSASAHALKEVIMGAFRVRLGL